MRTKFFTAALLLFGLNTSMAQAAEVEPDVPQTIEIVTTGIPKGEPRHIVFSPIECYYYSGVLYNKIIFMWKLAQQLPHL